MESKDPLRKSVYCMKHNEKNNTKKNSMKKEGNYLLSNSDGESSQSDSAESDSENDEFTHEDDNDKNSVTVQLKNSYLSAHIGSKSCCFNGKCEYSLKIIDFRGQKIENIYWFRHSFFRCSYSPRFRRVA